MLTTTCLTVFEAGCCLRGLDGAVGGGDARGVVARHRAETEARRRGLVQRHHGGAGVDHEVDALAVDPAVGREVTARIGRNAERPGAGLRHRDGRSDGLLCGRRGGGRHLAGHLAHEGAQPDQDGRENHQVTHDTILGKPNTQFHHAVRPAASEGGSARLSFWRKG